MMEEGEKEGREGGRYERMERVPLVGRTVGFWVAVHVLLGNEVWATEACRTLLRCPLWGRFARPIP